jgi:DNA-binding CsgD family transcriptional regulator
VTEIYSQRQVDRFWGNVQINKPDDCWPWKRSPHSSGYGQVGIRLNDRECVFKTHRVAWEITSKKRIPARTHALHTCGNKLCCNPQHIYLQGDLWPSDPHARGADHGSAKLTERQAIIVKYRLNDLTTREIAETVGVNYNTIWDIRHNKTWRHI